MTMNESYRRSYRTSKTKSRLEPSPQVTLRHPHRYYLHKCAFSRTSGAAAGNQGVTDDFDDETSQGSFLVDVPESDPQLEDTSQFEGAIVAWGCNDGFARVDNP
jgi:hypothetical protein